MIHKTIAAAFVTAFLAVSLQGCGKTTTTTQAPNALGQHPYTGPYGTSGETPGSAPMYPSAPGYGAPMTPPGYENPSSVVGGYEHQVGGYEHQQPDLFHQQPELYHEQPHFLGQGVPLHSEEHMHVGEPQTEIHRQTLPRKSVDGHFCEKTWNAIWLTQAGNKKSSSHCRGYCCFIRNQATHRRSSHSYCRVTEDHGVEKLRMCLPRHYRYVEMPVASLSEMSAAAEVTGEEEISEEDGELLDGRQAVALPVAAGFVGFLVGALGFAAMTHNHWRPKTLE